MRRLVNFRTLFISYLVCVLIVGILVTGGWIALNQQADRIEVNQARLAATDQKLCRAVKGAGDFWKGVRAVTLAEIADPETAQATRRADLGFVQSLNEVISKADVFCPPIK